MKAIVFDLDGTLIDTTDSIVSSLFAAFKYYKIQPNLSKNNTKNLMGLSLEETLNKLMDEKYFFMKDKIVNYYVKHYYSFFMDNAVAYSGVSDVLSYIKKQGFKIALATAKRTFCADKELSSSLLKDFFDVIQGTDENTPSKPDPKMLIDISEQLNVSLNEILMVGDTGRDVLFGKNAGCKTVAVTYGNWSRERFVEESIIPDYFIDNIKELTDLL